MSLTNDLDDFFANGDEVIVSEPLKFKAKLGIGDRAYALLRAREQMSTFSEAIGIGATASGFAASSTVAGTFFASSGFMASTLSAIGLGATAATPVGWVIAAGIISGGAYMGVSHLFEKSKDNGLIIVPKYINTPLDVIAVALIELMLPVSLKIANADGKIQSSELNIIQIYFSGEWGYSSGFLNRLIGEYRNQTDAASYSKLAESLGTYCSESTDCEKQSIMTDFIKHLREIIEANGEIDQKGREQLDYFTGLLVNESEKSGGSSMISSALNTASRGLSQSTEIASGIVISAKGSAAKGFKTLISGTSELASNTGDLASAGLGGSIKLVKATGNATGNKVQSLRGIFSKPILDINDCQVKAEQGDVEAQCSLGQIYYKGQGALQDYVIAYMYFNVAAISGTKEAIKNRDSVSKKMTPSQLEKAQKLAREWVQKHSREGL